MTNSAARSTRLALPFLLAFGLLVLSDASAFAQRRGMRRAEPAGEYGWLSSLEEGKALARQDGRPLMVVLRCVP